ncbi:MAG: hypothetical protein JSS94_07790 [Bacteroidetes bacterium]|nr:hypothetical protein [Bacteroidota bacterium]
MKKFLTYLMLMIYLFSFSEAKQLLKLPNLVEHYYSHVEKDQKTTLFSFLKMHYWDNHGKDADYKEDMKLPFKTHDSQCHAQNLNPVAPPKNFEFSFENFIDFLENKAVFTYHEPFTTSTIHSIFRPPVSEFYS